MDERILLIEDDSRLAGMVQEYLGKAGYHVVHAEDGARGLAVATTQRLPEFPDMPTAAEIGIPAWIVSTWYGMWVPKGTPKATNERIYTELQKAMATPELKQIWLNNGSEVPTLPSEQFGRFFSDEVRRWGKIAADSGAKLD